MNEVIIYAAFRFFNLQDSVEIIAQALKFLTNFSFLLLLTKFCLKEPRVITHK